MRAAPAREARSDRASVVKMVSGFGIPVDVLRTRYHSQRFARHSHDSYTLGLVLGGAGTFWCRGRERFAKKGDLVIIPPGEVHTGSVVSGLESLSYLAVYLPVDLAIMHAEAGGLCGGEPPEFGAVVVHDIGIRQAFQNLDRAIGSAPAFRERSDSTVADGDAHFDGTAAEEAVCLAVTELISRHAHREVRNDIRHPARGSVREPRLVAVVRAVLEESYARAEETSLEALAKRTGVNPFRIIRAFRQATGLAPHQYLVQVRVERARQFLAGGTIPSMAAFKTGFSDQSHLTYHFKKHLGITPGKYRRCVAMG